MHSSATDRRGASKCQGKWPDQTLDQAFGLPEVLVALSTSRLSCKRAGKCEHWCRFGIHLENLGIDGIQHSSGRPLDDLVLKSCDRQRTLPPVCLGNVYSP